MKKRMSKPPRLAQWLMEQTAKSGEKYTIVGDMDEYYTEMSRSRGKGKARLWYWNQVLMSIPALVQNSMYWRVVMFRNYLKVALRNIRKHKIYSFINISGLSVGMACCILIFLYVSHELSYDRYHEAVDRVFRVVLKISRESAQMETARVSTPLVPAIRESFPEVEFATRLQTMDWRRNLVERDEKKFYENLVMVADNDIFNVLTIPFIKGDPETALTRPLTVVLSESFARKYFGR